MRGVEDQWRRVGDAVRARREELGITQEQAAAKSDDRVSTANWRVIEKGGRTSYRRPTLDGVCDVLQWSRDSIDRLLAGEAPRPGSVFGVVKHAHHGSRADVDDDDPTLTALNADPDLSDEDRAQVIALVRRFRGH